MNKKTISKIHKGFIVPFMKQGYKNDKAEWQSLIEDLFIEVATKKNKKSVETLIKKMVAFKEAKKDWVELYTPNLNNIIRDAIDDYIKREDQ